MLQHILLSPTSQKSQFFFSSFQVNFLLFKENWPDFNFVLHMVDICVSIRREFGFKTIISRIWNYSLLYFWGQKDNVQNKIQSWTAVCFLLKCLGPNSSEFLFSLISFTGWMFSQLFIPGVDISHICEQSFLTHLHFFSYITLILSQKLACVWIMVSFKIICLAFILTDSIILLFWTILATLWKDK